MNPARILLAVTAALVAGCASVPVCPPQVVTELYCPAPEDHVFDLQLAGEIDALPDDSGALAEVINYYLSAVRKCGST